MQFEGREDGKGETDCDGHMTVGEKVIFRQEIIEKASIAYEITDGVGDKVNRRLPTELHGDC